MITKEDYTPRRDFMKRQKEINEKMREILVDWMQDVCCKFKLRTETYFLATNLVDRYLSVHIVTRDKFQLLGISSLFAAAKYEEIYPPSLSDFTGMCDGAYHKQELVKLESTLIQTVNFMLAVPSIVKFYQRYSNIAGLGGLEHLFGCYILELSLISSAFVIFRNSLMAASAVYLVSKLFSLPSEWSDELYRESGLSIEAVQPCAKELFVHLLKQEEARFTATKRKYAHSDYLEVSKYRFVGSDLSPTRQVLKTEY